ncbi:Protein phosphatase 2C 51 [Linum perenne]
MVPSPFDLAKKNKNARIPPWQTPLRMMPHTKKMKRISYYSEPEAESGGGLDEKTATIIPEPHLSDETTPKELISGEPSIRADTTFPIRTTASVSHGVVSVIGRRRVMEDAVAVVPGLEVGGFENYLDFFGVYDGQDGGGVVSVMCRNRMHLMVAMEAEKRSTASSSRGLDYWKKVMNNSFHEMDEEIRLGSNPEDFDGNRAAAVRATAVVVIVGKEEVVVANRGKSKAVLSRGGVALPLSANKVIKPLSLQLETNSSSKYMKSGKRHVAGSSRHFKFVPIMKRIKRRPTMKRIRRVTTASTGVLKGHLRKSDRGGGERERREIAGDTKGVNWKVNRFLGVLAAAATTSTGDDNRRAEEVTVTVTERSERDEFVVIGSDGLWDVISNETACAVVGKCLNGGIRMRFADDTSENCAEAAASFLAEFAMAKGSLDNISVIVVKL